MNKEDGHKIMFDIYIIWEVCNSLINLGDRPTN